jgi:hypothetical protein
MVPATTTAADMMLQPSITLPLTRLVFVTVLADHVRHEAREASLDHGAAR